MAKDEAVYAYFFPSFIFPYYFHYCNDRVCVCVRERAWQRTYCWSYYISHFIIFFCIGDEVRSELRSNIQGVGSSIDANMVI